MNLLHPAGYPLGLIRIILDHIPCVFLMKLEEFHVAAFLARKFETVKDPPGIESVWRPAFQTVQMSSNLFGDTMVPSID